MQIWNKTKKKMKAVLDLKKNYDKKIIRRLKDMKNFFYDKKAAKKLNENRKIYEVFVKRLGKFEIALTVIHPGSVGKEYFMTKGHYHKKPRPEIYIHQKGKGILLMQNKTIKEVRMQNKNIYLVPKGFAHRTVNVGKNKLGFISIYSSDAGHDYKRIEKEGFRKRILKK